MSFLNGHAAQAVLLRLNNLQASEPEAPQQLRAIAKEFQSEVVFEEDSELVRSIALLSEQAVRLGIAGDPEVEAAIHTIKALPPMGW